MDDAHPQPRIGEPLGGRVPGELSILGAHVARGHDLVDGVDVDHDRQLLHERPVPLLGLAQAGLRFLAIRHVLDHALPHGGVLPGLHDRRGVVHPHRRAVLPHEPVLDVERLARPVRAPGFGDHGRAVLGVDPGLPDARGGPLLRREADQFVHPRGDVVDTVSLEVDVHIAAIRDRGQLLHERSVPFLGALQGQGRLPFGGDVVHHAPVVDDAVVRHGNRLVAHPHLHAVGATDAVLRDEAFPGPDRPCPRRQDVQEIVRMHLPLPRLRVVEPLVRGVPKEAFDLRADVGGWGGARFVRGIPGIGNRRHLLDHRAIPRVRLGARGSFGRGATHPGER